MKEQKECTNNYKRSVGNDALVVPKLKRNTQTGITLIALIITIIVLLILAMVSIKLIWDGGIITHAKTASSKYTIEQEKELIGLGYSDYKMAKINDNSASLILEGAQVDGIGPWTITFQETGHIYTLQPDGNITEDASQNPGHSQVNLKELIDTKYAENNERIIQIAYMEEGVEADHKTATFSIFDKKIILYTFNETKGNDYTYIMPIENITVGESQTLKDMFPNYTDIESDTTKIKENTWYRLESTDSRINFGENVIPYSIKDNFSEENIVDKEVYNAIVNNFVV